MKTSIGHALRVACLGISVSAALAGCPAADPMGDPDGGSPLVQTLYVGHEGQLVSYDLAAGDERPGTVTNVNGPTDIQTLADGTVMVNLTNNNEVLVVDGRTMLEIARVPSSGTGGKRPVHSYVSPERNGKQYWLALNDGTGSDPATNSARFISITGANRFQPAGEVALGVGHHKATFSATRERLVVSNISDCNNVLGVYDYSDLAHIQAVKTWSAADFGWDNSSFARTCDPTFKNGVPPAPHGCATSKVSTKAYCNLTGSGEIIAVALDEAMPTFVRLETGGSGGGYTKAGLDGRFVYSLQESPREGNGGVTCQIGQLVTIDAQTDAIASKTPLLYKGPGCTTPISGTDEETAEPGHILVSKDGKTLYVTPAGGFGVATARVRQELVIDITDPAHPVQKASVPTGASTGHHGDALSGDGKFVLIANNVDGTVTQIDTATNTVVRTITVKSTPEVVATFGSNEGPSEQTGPIP